MIPVTTAWHALRLQMEERPPIWMVGANILYKQSHTANDSVSRFLCDLSKAFHCVNHMYYNQNWTGYHSRYSDWLWAGRSGDRIPVGARFSAPVQTGPEAHPASCTMGTGSFPAVKSSRGVTLTPHPLLVPLIMKE